MPSAKHIKNGELGDGSWFNIGSPGQLVTGMNPDGRKNPGFRFDGSGKSFQSESVARHVEGTKVPSEARRSPAPGLGARFTSRDCGVEVAEGRKGAGAEWFDQNLCVTSSKSPARKAASAKIAKTPLPLSSWIARTYRPAIARASCPPLPNSNPEPMS